MALTKTPIELSSTPGIVDNSNATAITIDSSENVALAGAISIVGGIGELSAPSANDLAIYGTASGHTGIRFHDVGILPTNNAGAITDNDCDIGIGTHRFKDLFLSGVAKADSLQFAQNSSATGATEAVYRPTTGAIAFKTNSAERMRIDSSGIVMVATTNTNPHTFTTGSGLSINSAGMLNAAKQAAVVQILNRTGNSDGVIQEYKKDGTTVGSIGSHVNGLLIGTTEGSDAFLKFESNAVRPSAWNGSYRDASIDLGHTSSRFKDLYLSGGVYLGGTGAANKLDDYESGTWTPSFSSGVTAGTVIGRYTKIGNVVTVMIRASFGATTTSTNQLTLSLPYVVKNDAALRGGLSIGMITTCTIISSSKIIYAQLDPNFSHIFFRYSNNGASWNAMTPNDMGTNGEFHIAGSYLTN